MNPAKAGIAFGEVVKLFGTPSGMGDMPCSCQVMTNIKFEAEVEVGSTKGQTGSFWTSRSVRFSGLMSRFKRRSDLGEIAKRVGSSHS